MEARRQGLRIAEAARTLDGFPGAWTRGHVLADLIPAIIHPLASLRDDDLLFRTASGSLRVLGPNGLQEVIARLSGAREALVTDGETKPNVSAAARAVVDAADIGWLLSSGGTYRGISRRHPNLEAALTLADRAATELSLRGVRHATRDAAAAALGGVLTACDLAFEYSQRLTAANGSREFTVHVADLPSGEAVMATVSREDPLRSTVAVLEDWMTVSSEVAVSRGLGMVVNVDGMAHSGSPVVVDRVLAKVVTDIVTASRAAGTTDFVVASAGTAPPAVAP